MRCIHVEKPKKQWSRAELERCRPNIRWEYMGQEPIPTNRSPLISHRDEGGFHLIRIVLGMERKESRGH